MSSPPLKLISATPAQQQAAFNKVWPELVALANSLVGTVNIPFINVQSMVEEKLADPATRRMVMKLLDDGLDAALNVAPAAPPPVPDTPPTGV